MHFDILKRHKLFGIEYILWDFILLVQSIGMSKFFRFLVKEKTDNFIMLIMYT